MEAELRGFGSGRDVVSAAKGGEKIVKSHLVRQVYDRKTDVPLVPVSAEDIVLSHGEVEEAARLNPLRVVIVVLGSRRGYFHQVRAELGLGAESR